MQENEAFIMLSICFDFGKQKQDKRNQGETLLTCVEWVRRARKGQGAGPSRRAAGNWSCKQACIFQIQGTADPDPTTW